MSSQAVAGFFWDTFGIPENPRSVDIAQVTAGRISNSSGIGFIYVKFFSR